jgi:ribosomal protein S18 acetylase RimI-like enzyme
MRESHFRIRLIREDDWPEFQVIDAELFPDDLMSHESFSRAISRGAFLALESDARIIGMLVVSKFGDSAGHLGRIGVAKSMQNQGLGARLMEHALDWFRNENLAHAILYTQDHNKHAQHLYKKFGFGIIGTTWHYFVPFSTITPTGNYYCSPIQENEIELVGQKYHEYLPAAQIRRFLESEDFHVLVLKNKRENVVGACRFTPSFPGCMPFQIDDLDGLDDFVSGMQAFSLPEYDYVRLTFTDNESLAALSDNRGYKRHHKLFRMRADISPK